MSNLLTPFRYSLFIIGLFTFSTFQVQAQSGKNTGQKKVILLNEKARFPGCEHKSFSKSKKKQCSKQKLEDYIALHLKYPDIAKNEDFKPRIVDIKITVEADGRINSPRLIKSDVKEYDRMAQTVFVQMVKDGIRWTPGQYEGEFVKSTINVPVHFTWDGRKNAFERITERSDVYEYVDEPAAFIVCQKAGLRDREVKACVQEKMAAFFKENMVYPEGALELGIEGDIEVEFVVAYDGYVRDIVLKNDLGQGCGQEAIRLVELLNNSDKLVWIPGEENGERVPVLEKATIPFRIEGNKKKNQKLSSVDARRVYVSEKEGYEKLIATHLKYPTGEDVNPCSQGVIEVGFTIDQITGDVSIVSMTDFNSLGKAFQSKAKDFLKFTKGKWNTKLPNLTSETVYKMPIPFTAKGDACHRSQTPYAEMVFNAMDAAEKINDQKKPDDHLVVLDKAVRAFPADNKLRFLQGMALYQLNRRVEACVNLSFVKQQNKDISVPTSCN